jgi:hypothetical protein
VIPGDAPKPSPLQSPVAASIRRRTEIIPLSPAVRPRTHRRRCHHGAGCRPGSRWNCDTRRAVRTVAAARCYAAGCDGVAVAVAPAASSSAVASITRMFLLQATAPPHQEAHHRSGSTPNHWEVRRLRMRLYHERGWARRMAFSHRLTAFESFALSGKARWGVPIPRWMFHTRLTLVCAFVWYRRAHTACIERRARAGPKTLRTCECMAVCPMLKSINIMS